MAHNVPHAVLYYNRRWDILIVVNHECCVEYANIRMQTGPMAVDAHIPAHTMHSVQCIRKLLLFS